MVFPMGFPMALPSHAPALDPATQQVLCQGDQREAFALSVSSVMVHADDLLGQSQPGPARCFTKNAGFDHGFYRIYPLEMRVLPWVLWENHGNIWGYPLVNIQKAIENGH